MVWLNLSTAECAENAEDFSIQFLCVLCVLSGKLFSLDSFAPFAPSAVNGLLIQVDRGPPLRSGLRKGDHSRLIMEATYPAPKPLSILTTLTLEAQEFSMPRSAAKPLKDAPYPTLVGTAITGTRASPPTTLGKAPSIPAHTIMTRALSKTSRPASRRWMPATPTS